MVDQERGVYIGSAHEYQGYWYLFYTFRICCYDYIASSLANLSFKSLRDSVDTACRVVQGDGFRLDGRGIIWSIRRGFTPASFSIFHWHIFIGLAVLGFLLAALVLPPTFSFPARLRLGFMVSSSTVEERGQVREDNILQVNGDRRPARD